MNERYYLPVAIVGSFVLIVFAIILTADFLFNKGKDNEKRFSNGKTEIVDNEFHDWKGFGLNLEDGYHGFPYTPPKERSEALPLIPPGYANEDEMKYSPGYSILDYFD